MRHLNVLVILLLLLVHSPTEAARPLSVKERPGQMLFYRQGKPYLRSNKRQVVYLEPLVESIKKRRVKFLMTIENNGRTQLNLDPSVVRVYDQSGRALAIKTKEEVIAKEKSREFWGSLMNGSSAVLNSIEARQAGKSHLYDSSHRYQGTLYNDYARKEAQRNARDRHKAQAKALRDQTRAFVAKVDSLYLDRHTLFPGESHQVLFQLTIPADADRHLEWLDIQVKLGGELHRFRVDCGPRTGWFS